MKQSRTHSAAVLMIVLESTHQSLNQSASGSGRQRYLQAVIQAEPTRESYIQRVLQAVDQSAAIILTEFAMLVSMMASNGKNRRRPWHS